MGSDRDGGSVLRLVQRSGQPFFCNAQGGRKGGQTAFDASGPGYERVGRADDPGLFTASARALGTKLWNMAGKVAAGTASGWNHGSGWRQPISARALYCRV